MTLNLSVKPEREFYPCMRGSAVGDLGRERPMERRASQRERTDGTGSISIDEHSSVGCIIYDVSENGVRVTLPEAEIVPSVFVLSAPFLSKTFVCEVAWRTEESIGAKFRV